MLVIPAFAKMRQEFEFETTGLHSEDLSGKTNKEKKLNLATLFSTVAF